MLAQERSHQRRSHLSAERLEFGELSDRSFGRLRVPLPDQRLNDLFEEARLAIGRDSPAAQMPRVDTEVEEPLRDPSDLEGVFVVRAVGVGDDQPVRRELLELFVGDAGHRCELGRVESDAGLHGDARGVVEGRRRGGRRWCRRRGSRCGTAGVTAAGRVVGAGHRLVGSIVGIVARWRHVGDAARSLDLAGRVDLAGVEPVLDHLKRQEVFLLLAQDAPQQFDVGVVELPVAGRRTFRLDQSLALEETDLRDRDVRELLDEESEHFTDRQM